jgi:hypothetical protein
MASDVDTLEWTAHSRAVGWTAGLGRVASTLPETLSRRDANAIEPPNEYFSGEGRAAIHWLP